MLSRCNSGSRYIGLAGCTNGGLARYSYRSLYHPMYHCSLGVPVTWSQAFLTSAEIRIESPGFLRGRRRGAEFPRGPCQLPRLAVWD